jgi:hypothetical protein
MPTVFHACDVTGASGRWLLCNRPHTTRNDPARSAPAVVSRRLTSWRTLARPGVFWPVHGGVRSEVRSRVPKHIVSDTDISEQAIDSSSVE